MERTVIHVDVAGGIDTKTDDKLVLPGSLVELENGVFNRGSVISKRNGYTALSTSVEGSTVSISAGSALGQYRNELFLFGGSRLYSYSPNRTKWVDKGSFISGLTESNVIIRNDYQQSRPDVAIFQNIALYAWEDSRNGIRATLIDLDSGVSFISDVQVTATGSRPRCINIGSSLVIVFVDSTSLKGIRVDSTNWTAFKSEFTIVSSDLNGSNKVFDIVPFGSASVFAYADASTNTTVGYLLENETVGIPLTGYAAAVDIAEQPISTIAMLVTEAEDRIYIAVHNGSGVRVFSLNADLTLALAVTTVENIVSVKNITMAEEATANDIVFFYEISAAATYNHYIKKNTYDISGSSMGSSAVFKRSCGLASKPFLYDSVLYINMIHDSTLQNTYFCVDENGNIAGKWLPGNAGGVYATECLPQVTEISSKFYLAGLAKTSLTSVDSDVFTVKGVAGLSIDFNNSQNFYTQDLGDNLHIGGGFLNMYDGETITEHGFHLFPENVTSADQTSGGSVADGTYSIRVVYEWQDNQGRVHHSAPSVAISDTVSGSSGNGSIVVTIPTLRLTNKTLVVCEVYRTEDAGTTYYLDGTVNNDTTADTVAYTCTLVDATLISKKLLYTTGGVVDNITPPACSIMADFKNRLFVLDSENPDTVLYSKDRTQTEPVEFHDAFKITVKSTGEEGGDVTNLWEMDDKLIFFKKNRLMFIAGDGPTNVGEQNSFSNPQLISADVGCSNTRSIVLTPLGLMFKSNKGIYLLTRSLETQYIGAPVEFYNSETVTSAVLVRNNNQVRFTTASGVCLMYDYFFNKWSTFTNHTAESALMYQGVYHYLKSNGEVYKEDSTYNDDSKSIGLRIKTNWINVGGVQGFQRIYRAIILGNYKSDHILRLSVAYDYDEAIIDTYEYNYLDVQDLINYGDNNYGDNEFGGVEFSGTYQFRFGLSRQKCQSVQFTIEDLMPDIVGESFTLVSTDLEVSIKRGLNKLKAGATSAAT